MANPSDDLRRSFSDLHWTEQEIQFLGLKKKKAINLIWILKRERHDGTKALKTLKHDKNTNLEKGNF